MGKDIHAASMDVEVTAVIRNGYNDASTKGCVMVMEELS